MLFFIINEEKLDLIKEKIKVESYIIDGKQGYDIVLLIEFYKINKKGYINLLAVFELEKYINRLKNRSYKSILFLILKIFITMK